MPELPDVAGFRRYFNRYAAGGRIDRVEVRDRSMLRDRSPQAIGRALRGRSFEEADRRGKWLIAPASGRLVLMHFGMTGELAWSGAGGTPHRHDRLVFHLARGVLAYRNMRKFGGVWLARDGREAEAIMGPLGPDALEVSREEFRDLLGRRRGRIKPLLMDQKAVAGVGNLLADEILWRARVNPRRPAYRLSWAKVDRTYDAMRAASKESSRHGRIPRKRGWVTAVRAERDPHCPRCGTRMTKATVGGRTACWCPRCQRG
jgi:formamidopyrimidine-DNA glycosylase